MHLLWDIIYHVTSSLDIPAPPNFYNSRRTTQNLTNPITRSRNTREQWSLEYDNMQHLCTDKKLYMQYKYWISNKILILKIKDPSSKYQTWLKMYTVAGKVCFCVAWANSLWCQGAWRVAACCSWPPLQLASMAYRLCAHAFHAFRLQTDRGADITTRLHIVFHLYRWQRQKILMNWAYKQLLIKLLHKNLIKTAWCK